MGKLVLIDGHSILNRAFYGVPDLTNSEGLHTNAVYGFLNIMFKILDEEKADHLAVAFDLKEPTFRHKMYAEYKGTRKPMPQELHEQVPLIKEVLRAMGIPILTLPGYEADDILGTVARRSQREGICVSVISGDRDLLQLADERIKIRIPKTIRATTEIHDYYPADVKREYQVTPEEFIDVKALMGDASDNIPGVPSIGEKTATAIIVEYGSIENAYAHRDEIRPPRAKKALEEHYAMAQMSKALAAICTDCPIAFSYEDAAIDNLYTPEVYQLLKRLEFKSILTRFDADAMGGTGMEAGFLAVDDLTEAQRWVERAVQAVSSADGETGRTGLQLIAGPVSSPETDAAGSREAVIGLALSHEDGQTVCIRAQGKISEAWLRGAAERIIGSARLPKLWTLDVKKILSWLSLEDGAAILDSRVAGYLLNPLKDSYAYDDLARDWLGVTLPSEKDLLGKKKAGEVFREEDDKGMLCAEYMAWTAGRTAAVLEKRLKEDGMWKLFLDVEMPLIYSLHRMEKTGIKVKRQALRAYGEKLKVQIARLEAEIYADCGQKFNINSPRQLGEILFGQMKLKGGKKTKTGYSTAADVLEKLAPQVPVVQKILDYRQLTKLNSTYAEGLAEYIGPDERIHGTFNQTITATGRISSTEPNLQNIPVRMELGREIRKVFVPEEGYVFVDADYSQIELRILAALSGDQRLIDAYNSAQDIHVITASEVFHVPLDQVTPQQRRDAKAVNFGIVYGISAFGLGEDLSVSRKEAQAYIDKYFETYPGVKAYLDGLVAQGKEQGYVTTLYGRRRPIPELWSGNFMQRSFGERVAMNSPIQGTAADIMKIAMIGVDRELRRLGLRSRIVLQVHDELLIETWEPETAKVKEILEDKMKHASQLKVALEVEAKEGGSWYEAK